MVDCFLGLASFLSVGGVSSCAPCTPVRFAGRAGEPSLDEELDEEELEEDAGCFFRFVEAEVAAGAGAEGMAADLFPAAGGAAAVLPRTSAAADLEVEAAAAILAMFAGRSGASAAAVGGVAQASAENRAASRALSTAWLGLSATSSCFARSSRNLPFHVVQSCLPAAKVAGKRFEAALSFFGRSVAFRIWALIGISASLARSLRMVSTSCAASSCFAICKASLRASLCSERHLTCTFWKS